MRVYFPGVQCKEILLFNRIYMREFCYFGVGEFCYFGVGLVCLKWFIHVLKWYIGMNMLFYNV